MNATRSATTATPPTSCPHYRCEHGKTAITRAEILTELARRDYPLATTELGFAVLQTRGCTAPRTNGMIHTTRNGRLLTSMAKDREIVLVEDDASYFTVFGCEAPHYEPDGVHYAALPQTAERMRAEAARRNTEWQTAQLTANLFNERLRALGLGDLARPEPGDDTATVVFGGDAAALRRLLMLAEAGHAGHQ
jgi:hypothetical protein